MTFPDWLDHFRVPTVGDDVCIACPDVVTVTDDSSSQASSFALSVQPKSTEGVLGSRGRSIKAVISRTHADTASFINQYVNHAFLDEEHDNLRVGLKNLLENYRSVLEYVAHFIAERCTPVPPAKAVKFPVANDEWDRAKFLSELDRWFPGLERNIPEVRDYLASQQMFAGERWLYELADVTNFNKHHELSAQEVAEFQSISIGAQGARLRIGELGLNSLRIEDGAAVEFKICTQQVFRLSGPLLIISSTRTLPYGPCAISIVEERRTLHRIPGKTHSLPHDLWLISKNVLRSVDQLCRLLSVH